MNERAVRYEAKDGIALITLDRPDVLNAMTPPMRTELHEFFARLRKDDAV
jgi:enoyl-CoA hydratase/carnithine racemase